MRLVIQRVTSGSVSVDERLVAQIGLGLVVLVGIHESDTEKDLVKMAAKLVKLRLFARDSRPVDAAIQSINGELLLISQFTLYGDCTKGNRPSFSHAMAPDKARLLFEQFVAECSRLWPQTKQGVFGANMQVSLVNDGPVTIVLDS